MKKNVFYSLMVTSLFLTGTGIALAQGGFGMGLGLGNSASLDDMALRHEEMFKNQAVVLGMSIEDYKAAWAEGKNFFEIAESKGFTKEQLFEKMKAQKQTQMKAMLQKLVEKGVITQAQADQRLANWEKAQTNGTNGQKTRAGFGKMHGMMKGMF